MAVIIDPGKKIGADWSFSKFTPEFMKDRGVKLAVRYIGGSQSKRLTVAERDGLFAAGIAILLVFEAGETDALQGGAKGTDHGGKAKQQAKDLGYPTDMPILAGVDTDITSPTRDEAEAYVRKFAEAIKPHPVGVYGDTDIIEACKDISQVNWLANATDWSNMNAPARQLVHIRQRATVHIDDDHAYDPDDVEKSVRAWFPGIDPLIKPHDDHDNDHDNEEDDMATTLPATAALVSVPGLANAFLVGVGPALHLDPVLFEHYRALGVPVVNVSEHRQLMKSLAHQSGVDIFGPKGVPI